MTLLEAVLISFGPGNRGIQAGGGYYRPQMGNMPIPHVQDFVVRMLERDGWEPVSKAGAGKRIWRSDVSTQYFGENKDETLGGMLEFFAGAYGFDRAFTPREVSTTRHMSKDNQVEEGRQPYMVNLDARLLARIIDEPKEQGGRFKVEIEAPDERWWSRNVEPISNSGFAGQ